MNKPTQGEGSEPVGWRRRWKDPSTGKWGKWDYSLVESPPCKGPYKGENIEVEPLYASPPPLPVGNADPRVREAIAERIVRDVAELPDRTSPDDAPDMMLVTDAELTQIILDVLRRASDEQPVFALSGREKVLEDALREIAKDGRYVPDPNSSVGVQKWQPSYAANIARVALASPSTPEPALHSGSLNDYARVCHEANIQWWQRPEDGTPIERNKGELLMLIVSEVAECMEGERKGLPDDKLPHRSMAEVELADILIRVFDYAGAHGYDLHGAYIEKMAFNAAREDHKHEARVRAGGKKW